MRRSYLAVRKRLRAKATQRGVRHVMSTLWRSMGHYQGFLLELWVICTYVVFARDDGWLAWWSGERTRGTGCPASLYAELGQLPGDKA